MGLAGSVGAVGLGLMGVAASAPAVVLTGGVTTMYAATGLVAVPVSFLVLGLAFAPVTVAFAAASRHLGHAATAYALLAQGLGRVAGVAGGAVAVVSYTAIGCSLYGLFGVAVSGEIGGAWWWWAAGAWVVVALLGRASLTANVAVIGVGVGLQVLVLAAVVWAALAHPAEGISPVGLSPSGLLTDGAAGLGGVLAFAVAAFIGYESPASYVEESRSAASLRPASFAALGFLAVGYTVAAWAVGIGYGPSHVIEAARDPGLGMPLGLLGGVAPLATFALLVAIVLSMVSFHHLAARYLYRMGYERVLPAGLGGVARGARAGVPAVASFTQSAITLAVILGYAVTGVDPIGDLFVPDSALAAIGVLALLTASSWAAGRYFAKGGGANEGALVRKAAPVLGFVSGLAVLTVVAANLHTLLGVQRGAALTVVLPVLIAVTALAGAARGWWLRRYRPDVYEAVGQGQPRQAARLDPRLADLPL